MQDKSLGWLALNCISGIGPVTAHTLVQLAHSPELVFSLPMEMLSVQRGVSADLAQHLRQTDWKALGLRELEKCQTHGCRVLTLEESEYPALLRMIPFPPPILYVRGTLLPQDQQAIAVVGSRKPSTYGMAAVQSLAKDLAKAGLTLVSGLARGIDSLAHQAAIQTHGRTLAVVAHGLDQLYPPEHKALQQQIEAHGAVLSEFPLGVPPLPQHFPRRNRIISGLSLAVLVIEAREKSGALITARWAGEQGRDVFAVPGSFQSALSKGTHALIQDGAKLVTTVEDILCELPQGERVQHSQEPSQVQLLPGRPKPEPLEPELAKIRCALETQALHVDQLAAVCERPVQELMANLLQMELLGMVKSTPGPVYQWIRE